MRSLPAVTLAHLATVSLMCAACAQELPKVSSTKSGADYNRGALLSTVKQFGDAGRTPEAYREMAARIEDLRPGFDEDVALEADRNLVFLALPPLESVLERPADGQMFELAPTVWPVVLEDAPREGESPRQYVDRLCGDSLASVCRRVVETHRPAFVLAEVWLRFRDRAREALADCMTCDEESGFPPALERFEVVAKQLAIARTSQEEAGSPSQWPTAREHGSPWTERPLLTIDGEGRAWLQGSSLKPEEWRSALTAVREGERALGVFVGPNERLSTIRALSREAVLAGFSQLVLQSREASYPYALRGYAISLERRGKAVRLREIDTAQVLVHLVDDFTDRGEVPRIEWIAAR